MTNSRLSAGSLNDIVSYSDTTVGQIKMAVCHPLENTFENTVLKLG